MTARPCYTFHEPAMTPERCDACGAPAAFCYGIGGGWGLACQDCRDLATQPGNDNYDTMTAEDFFQLDTVSGCMTPHESARFDALGRQGLSE